MAQPSPKRSYACSALSHDDEPTKPSDLGHRPAGFVQFCAIFLRKSGRSRSRQPLLIFAGRRRWVVSQSGIRVFFVQKETFGSRDGGNGICAVQRLQFLMTDICNDQDYAAKGKGTGETERGNRKGKAEGNGRRVAQQVLIRCLATGHATDLARLDPMLRGLISGQMGIVGTLRSGLGEEIGEMSPMRVLVTHSINALEIVLILEDVLSAITERHKLEPVGEPSLQNAIESTMRSIHESRYWAVGSAIGIEHLQANLYYSSDGLHCVLPEGPITSRLQALWI
ncbi:hypothetical protein F5887DRAFT_1165045 [Amanita rubescens]|nr:hypothetical protein F5887DRAFT_1165045 [Amanita rubescens]